MAASNIRVTGEQDILRRLVTLPVKLQRKVIRQASRKAAKPVRARARALAPVRTGRLRRSIKLRSIRRNRRGRIGVNVLTGTREELGITAGGYYPAAQEYGWRSGGRRVSGVRYFRRALTDLAGQTERIMRTEILAGIEREARR